MYKANRQPAIPSRSKIIGGRLVAGLIVAVLALLAVPAAAQEEFLPRLCGFRFGGGEEWCAQFGLVPSWEKCECIAARISEELIPPGGGRELRPEECYLTRSICQSQGKWFDAGQCRCRFHELVPPVTREMPSSWWNAMPPGIVTWKEDKLFLHRGEGLFIVTEVAGLGTALPLALSGARVEDIEAEGLLVVEVDALR